MGGAGTSYWKVLERWSPRLFLAAGGFLLVYASLNGAWAFAEMATRRNGFQFGYVLGFLGLLGLYPSLVDRSPWLARAGAVAAASGVVGITAITAVELTQLAGLATGPPPAWSVVRLLALGGFVVGYLSFGVAILRSGDHPKSNGFVVLVPGLIVVLMLAHIAAGYASDATAFVISAGEAMAHLAVGATLRTRSSRPTEEAPTGDAPVEMPTHE